MSNELFYFFILFCAGIFFCFYKIKTYKIYWLITILFLFGFSLVTRYSGFDVDMNTYSKALESNSFSMYYLKEPIYWIFSRYIYNVTSSAELTFIFFDFISFILFLKASKNMKMPQYFPYLLILFFPIIMGINNVYRQYLSYSFFLYFFSLFFIYSGTIKKIFVLILAVLTHNVAALFSPLLFTINKSKGLSLKALLMYLIIIVSLPYAISTKSSSDTGSIGVELYILIIFLIIIFYSVSYRMKFNGIEAKLFYFLNYMFVLLNISSIYMGGAQSKRVGMFIIIISLVPLIKAIEENYKQKIFMRLLLYNFCIVPTVIFSNSKAFLLT